jgi:uncharacterized protein YndB with AHSA1/START domain
MSKTVQARTVYTFPEARCEQVFDAWTQEDLVRTWGADEELARSTGSDGGTEVTIDLREGGGFRFAERRGETLAENWGTYLRVERPRLLEFTWFADDETGDETSIVRIEIEELAVGCEVTLTHTLDAEWVDVIDRTANAWHKMHAAIERSLS